MILYLSFPRCISDSAENSTECIMIECISMTYCVVYVFLIYYIPSTIYLHMTIMS